MLLVDTPGRGSSMYLRGIPTRPDYEVPGMASIDWLVSRPEVDPDRIGLMGISMAGYYAPRVAAFDERVKALIAWCGCYSLLDDIYLFYDGLSRRSGVSSAGSATKRRWNGSRPTRWKGSRKKSPAPP